VQNNGDGENLRTSLQSLQRWDEDKSNHTNRSDKALEDGAEISTIGTQVVAKTVGLAPMR
jgi:hypothetical protein